MENTPEFRNTQPLHFPRAILSGAIVPFYISAPLTPAEITVEKIIHRVEVEATRPAYLRALAGALGALGGVA